METTVYTAVNTFFINATLILVFWNSPNFKKKAALVSITLNVLLKLICVSGLLFPVHNVRFLEIIFSLISLFIYSFCINFSIPQLLLVYFLVLDYVIIVRGIVSYVSVRSELFSPQSWGSILLSIILYMVSVPVILHFTKRTIKRFQNVKVPSFWRMMWMIPAINTMIVLIFTNVFQSPDTIGTRFILARILLTIVSLVLCILLLQAMENVVQQTVLREQLKYTEHISELQKAQYIQLQERIEEMRRFRHDMRQHINLIQSYLSSGNTKALKEYMDTYKITLPSPPQKHYCKHPTLDTLLGYYGEKYASSGIDFETNINLPETLPFPDPDLCVIFGNLLENALESCSAQKDPKIRIAAGLSGVHTLFLIVDNTAPVPPKATDASFFSSKHEGLGIGTQSVKYLAEHYNGKSDFQWENGFFHASVFLNPLEH